MKELSSNVVNVVGITGLPCTGKTLACLELAKKIYPEIKVEALPVISTDDIARGVPVMERYEAEAKKILGSWVWGTNNIFSSSKAAVRLFCKNDICSKRRCRYQDFVFPIVRGIVLDKIEVYKSLGFGVVFVESALLFESGLHDLCSVTVCVTATPRVLSDRICSREPHDKAREQMRFRSSLQLSQEQKLKNSDIEIKNSSGDVCRGKGFKSLFNILKKQISNKSVY